MNELVSKEAIQELQKALTPVVVKLGQGGEFVYRTYYKQQIVFGIYGILGALLGLVILLATYKFCKYAYKECQKESYSSWEILGTLVGISGSIIGLLFVILSVPEAVGRLINPDYYILQELLSIIKK